MKELLNETIRLCKLSKKISKKQLKTNKKIQKILELMEKKLK